MRVVLPEQCEPDTAILIAGRLLAAFRVQPAFDELASSGQSRITRRRIGLGGQAFQVGSTPEANILNQRQHRSTIVRQRILDRGGDRALRFATHDPITHELAKLLSKDLLRDAGHDPPKAPKMLR